MTSKRTTILYQPIEMKPLNCRRPQFTISIRLGTLMTSTRRLLIGQQTVTRPQNRKLGRLSCLSHSRCSDVIVRHLTSNVQNELVKILGPMSYHIITYHISAKCRCITRPSMALQLHKPNPNLIFLCPYRGASRVCQSGHTLSLLGIWPIRKVSK